MKSFLFVLLLACTLVAQSFRSSDEIKVNTDPEPATFLQYDPLLYHIENEDYSALWLDTREGKLTSYGQKISGGLTISGTNFKPLNRTPVKYISGNTYFTVSETYTTTPVSYYTTFIFKKVQNDEVVNSTEYLMYEPPGCGIGAYGEEVNILPCESSLLVITKMNGPMAITRFDMDGNVISTKRDSGCTVFSGKHTVGMLENGNYAIFYIDPYVNPSYQTGLISFFNADDESFVDSINAGIYMVGKEAFVPSDINAGIRIFDNGNNNYLAMALNPDSAKIRAQLFTSSGEPTGRDRIFSLPVNWGVNYTSRIVTNFEVTPTGSDNFLIIASVRDDSRNKTYNFQLECNASGEFSGNYYLDSSLVFNLADKLLLNSDNTITVVSEENNDIYVTKIKDLRALDSQKINDDQIGGNENVFGLFPLNGNGAFAAYNNEQEHLGRRILDAEGSLGPEMITPIEEDLKFLSDGTAILPWYKIESSMRMAGLIYFDEVLDTLKIDTLLVNAPSVASRLTADVLNDDLIVVYMVENQNEAVVQTRNYDGELVSEADASQFGSASGLDIIPIEDGTFFLVNQGKVLRLDKNLETVTGTIHKFNNMFKHLTENIFVDYQNSISVQGALYGRIVDIEEGNLAEIPVISEVSYNVSFYGLESNQFIVNYPKDDDIYYSVYDYSGNLIAKDIPVCSAVTNNRYVFKTTKSGNHIYYIWSEINENSVGQDIYTKVYSINELTTVQEADLPDNFVLNQNYPNPFNPATTITFSLPENCVISLKLFDILGREVSTLLSGELSAGVHQVELNASELSSGVYFYKLETTDGKYNAVRKLMLLK